MANQKMIDANEEIHAIPGFNGYFITKSAKVYSRKNGKLRRIAFKTKNGYERAVLFGKPYIRNVFGVHMLMLMTFVSPRPKKMQGCHRDGNPLNNKLSNLRWDTPKGNSADNVSNGTDLRGIKNPSVKLNELQVRIVRRNTDLPCYFLAEVFDVSSRSIGNIRRGKTWKYLKSDDIKLNKVSRLIRIAGKCSLNFVQYRIIRACQNVLPSFLSRAFGISIQLCIGIQKRRFTYSRYNWDKETINDNL